jgi:hypothetical protein
MQALKNQFWKKMLEEKLNLEERFNLYKVWE